MCSSWIQFVADVHDHFQDGHQHDIDDANVHEGQEDLRIFDQARFAVVERVPNEDDTSPDGHDVDGHEGGDVDQDALVLEIHDERADSSSVRRRMRTGCE